MHSALSQGCPILLRSVFSLLFFPLYSSAKVTDQKQPTHYTLASSAFLFFFWQLLCSIRNIETRVSVHGKIKREGPSASSFFFSPPPSPFSAFCFVTAKHTQTVKKKKQQSVCAVRALATLTVTRREKKKRTSEKLRALKENKQKKRRRKEEGEKETRKKKRLRKQKQDITRGNS